jgi:hypothetical protein
MEGLVSVMGSAFFCGTNPAERIMLALSRSCRASTHRLHYRHFISVLILKILKYFWYVNIFLDMVLIKLYIINE